LYYHFANLTLTKDNNKNTKTCDLKNVKTIHLEEALARPKVYIMMKESWKILGVSLKKLFTFDMEVQLSP